MLIGSIGGARRDEDKSRAKERVFSFRNEHHRWDPKQQRPEPWRLFNARMKKGESVRVFPLSNWTERDVWRYVLREKLEVVPLYLAALRPTIVRNGQLLMLDDNRLTLQPNETVENRMIATSGADHYVDGAGVTQTITTNQSHPTHVSDDGQSVTFTTTDALFITKP